MRVSKFLVLEKHGDFLRDFRGDTIHPSTLEVMSELGLLEEFLKLPHQKVYELDAQVGEMWVTIADFRHLPTHCGFIAMMPQWDFLNFLAEKAARFPNFARWKRKSPAYQESGRVMGFAQIRLTGRSKFAPISSWAPTAGLPSCANRPV